VVKIEFEFLGVLGASAVAFERMSEKWVEKIRNATISTKSAKKKEPFRAKSRDPELNWKPPDNKNRKHLCTSVESSDTYKNESKRNLNQKIS
jgi:hypothetical protein